MADVISQYSGGAATDTGIGTEIMADTIGVLWRAGSGTVDPWTKDQIIANGIKGQITGMGFGLGDSEVIPGTGQTVGSLKAIGYTDDDLQTLREQAWTQIAGGGSFSDNAGDVVTKILTMDKADPSQFLDGLKANTLDRLNPLNPGSLGFYLLLAGVGIAALVLVVRFGKA